MSSFFRLGWSMVRLPFAMAAALTGTSLANAKEAGRIKHGPKRETRKFLSHCIHQIGKHSTMHARHAA